jgi:hypothetical protein
LLHSFKEWAAVHQAPVMAAKGCLTFAEKNTFQLEGQMAEMVAMAGTTSSITVVVLVMKVISAISKIHNRKISNRMLVAGNLLRRAKMR